MKNKQLCSFQFSCLLQVILISVVSHANTVCSLLPKKLMTEVVHFLVLISFLTAEIGYNSACNSLLPNFVCTKFELSEVLSHTNINK